MNEPLPGSLDIDTFLEKYKDAVKHPFDSDQEAAVRHPLNPLQLLAGPGSGKSEVTVARAIRTVLVDGEDPRSVFVTTYTEKAARNLQDRIADRLLEMGYSTSLDDLRIGTLHSLCEEVMHQYRFQGVADRRLLNEHEQAFFVYSRTDATNYQDRQFWNRLSYLRGNSPWSTEYGPNKWQRTHALVTLFNRIADEEVPLDRLTDSQDPIQQKIGEMAAEYREKLAKYNRTDFSLLQLQFRAFLSSDNGARFLHGDLSRGIPPLRHVLVDEYQDTNPAQETIYLEMARQIGGAITIVGDDDQALYRFRGGTVACLVRFPSECDKRLAKQVKQIQLRTNYRSLPPITTWNNRVLKAQPVMSSEGVRAPKEDVTAHRKDIPGHKPVCMVSASTAPEAARRVAGVIRQMIDERLVEDPAHIAILMKSTKESPNNAEHIMRALREAQVPFYNPRSKALLQSPEVQAMIGGILEVLDPENEIGVSQQGRVKDSIARWRNSFLAHVASNPKLKDHLKQIPSHAVARLKKYEEKQAKREAKGKARKQPYIPVTIRDIFYRLLAFEPFRTWHAQDVSTRRLGALSEILEAFASVETTDEVKLDTERPGKFDQGWLTGQIYPRLVGFFHNAELNEPEDLDYEVPPHKVQLMTVHQAKGLEFPVVFVGSLIHEQGGDDSTYQLEDFLVPLSENPRDLRSREDRALEDTVRFFYVAGTRAMNLLVYFGRNGHFSQAKVPLARPMVI